MSDKPKKTEIIHREIHVHYQIPVINIDHLAEQMGLERRWIRENWLEPKEDDPVGPAPSFSDGRNTFLNLKELEEWSRRRSYGSGSTDMPTDQLD